MNGMVIVVVAAVVLVAGYLVYGRWLAKTWGVDARALTPAKRMEDGKNFSPASCFTAFRASRRFRTSSAPSAAQAL